MFYYEVVFVNGESKTFKGNSVTKTSNGVVRKIGDSRINPEKVLWCERLTEKEVEQ